MVAPGRSVLCHVPKKLETMESEATFAGGADGQFTISLNGGKMAPPKNHEGGHTILSIFNRALLDYNSKQP